MQDPPRGYLKEEKESSVVCLFNVLLTQKGNWAVVNYVDLILTAANNS